MTITQTSRRLALVAAAAVLAALLPFGVASAQDQDGDADITLDLEGESNDQYAVAWSRQAYPDGALADDNPDNDPTRAFIGRDDLFPDNLASGQLQDEGPLLLTPGDALSQVTADELARLGVTDVTVLGGEVAISEDVVAELEDLGLTVDRLEGITRIETAIAIADANEDNGTVLIARAFPGDADETSAWADSLAAGAWAAAADADLLLTQTEELTASTADALAAGEYDNVVIIGGPVAISEETEAAITEINENTTRVSGDDRAATAVAIANERGFETSADAAVTIVVDGWAENAWADGFSAANIAGINDYPVVLSNSTSDELPPATQEFLVEDGTEFAAHLTEVDAICGSSVPDSDTTNDQCQAVADETGTTVSTVPFLTGDEVTVTPASAAAGDDLTITIPGAVAGDEVVISGCGIDETVTVTDEDINEDGDAVITVTIPTSQAAGDCDVSVTVNGEEQGPFTIGVTAAPGNEDTNSRPELVRAELGTLVTAAQATASNPAGQRVLFYFDEPLTSVNLGLFSVYNSSQTPEGGFVAATATIDQTNNTVAIVNFTAVTTQAAADQLTLATVAPGAVNDFQGQSNPDGDAPIGTASSTPGGAPGVTTAPDLLSIGGFREGTTAGVTAVDFTFDQAAFVTGGGAFQIVNNNNTTLTCNGPAAGSNTAGGAAVAGGNGTTVITVLCNEPAAPTNLVAADFTRGVVDTGTVGDTATFTNTNALQAADNANGGNTIGPDLVAAAFQPEAAAGVDQVVYQFDQTPLVAGAANLFGVYDANGDEVFGTAVASTNGQLVTVNFADGTLANAVGANVETGAVTSNGNQNQRDEVGVQNDFVTTRTPGQIAGPQLTDVSVVEQPSPFPPGPTVVVYTFDIDVAAPVNASFHIFLADGTQFDGTNCTVGASEDTDNVVTCTTFNGGATTQTLQSAVLGTVSYAGVQGQSNNLDSPEQGEAI